MNETQRRALIDPQDNNAVIRAQNEERRHFRAPWGGHDITDKYVFVETIVYHYIGKVESIQSGVIWLSNAYKTYEHDGTKITHKDKVGRLSIPSSTVVMLTLKGECEWY